LIRPNLLGSSRFARARTVLTPRKAISESS
jgi:hypothetical protein